MKIEVTNCIRWWFLKWCLGKTCISDHNNNLYNNILKFSVLTSLLVVVKWLLVGLSIALLGLPIALLGLPIALLGLPIALLGLPIALLGYL